MQHVLATNIASHRCLQMHSKSGKKIGRPIVFQVSTPVTHVDALELCKQLGQD